MFWKKWDERKRTTALKIAGLFVAAFTIFATIATVSYLFHWKQDMSLLSDPFMMDASNPVANKAGKLGSRFGHFLVCDLFGLGSLALIVILAAVSVRLLAQKWNYSLSKTCLVALFGAVISSITLAFIGKAIGLDDVFGGGLGGGCGEYIDNWAINLFGYPVTLIFILTLIIGWLFFSSRRFTDWICSLGKKKEAVAEPEADLEEEPEPETRPQAVGKTEPKANAEPKAAAIKEEPAVQEGTMEIIEDDTLNKSVEEELKPIDNRMDPPEGLPRFKFPSLDLLESHSGGRREVSTDELARNNNKIRASLKNYRIDVVDVKAIVGPTVTLYKVYPAPGVQIAQIKRLQEDIALSLNAKGVRVVTLSDSVGIEVANDYASIVPLKSLLNDDAFRESKAELPVAIGYTITQKVKVFDLADAPHLLIAGATKQGKSVGLNVIVSSLLYRMHPSELKFVFIDP